MLGQADLLDLMTYLRKSYHKTASLICDAAKVAVCKTRKNKYPIIIM